MYTWLKKTIEFLSGNNQSIYREILLKRSFKVMLIQAIGLALTFSGNILLARIYGEQVYGIYSLVTSWSLLIAVIALWGMDDSHLVKLPGFRLRQEKGKISSQWRWSLKIVIISSMLTIIGSYLIIRYGHIKGISDLLPYFNYGLIMVLLLAFYNNLLSFLRGIDLVVPGEIIDKIFRPMGFLVFMLLFYYLWPGISAGPPLVANNIVLLIVFITAFIIVLPFIHRSKSEREGENTFSIRPNTRYVLLNVLYLLSSRLDILMLGILSVPIAVGHYNVAIKFSDVFAYPMAIINLSMPTLLARERHEHGDQTKPAYMFMIARNSFFQCLGLAIVFLLTGNWLLGWYGSGFVQAFPALCILLASNLLSAATGSIDVFFIMHGEEKKAIYSRITSLATSIVAGICLIPRYGMVGAALAMLSGNLVYCTMLEWLFFRRYRTIIHPFQFRTIH